MEALASFNNTFDAMFSERIVKEHDINARLIPMPEKIDANCGLTLKFQKEDLNQLKSLFDQKELIPQNFYEIHGNRGNREYIKIEI